MVILAHLLIYLHIVGDIHGENLKLENLKLENLASSGQNFQILQPSSKCCKVRLSTLKIRMNLENESLFFSERRHDFLE